MKKKTISDRALELENILVCEECGHTFTQEELNKDSESWGHTCKQHPCRKGQRCESYLEKFSRAALEEDRKEEIWCGGFDGKVLRLANSQYKDIMRAKVPGKLVFSPDNASK